MTLAGELRKECDAIAERFGSSLPWIIGRNRSYPHALARLAIYRHLTSRGYSIWQVGKLMRRSHATVWKCLRNDETRHQQRFVEARMNRVGFTGTRHGMTEYQRDGIAACLAFAFIPGSEFHHGDNGKSDHEAARIAQEIGYRIIGHPGPFGPHFPHNHATPPRKDWLERNHDIVRSVDELYATPETAEEQLRSGTWATVRYARKAGKAVQVIGPNRPKDAA